MFRIGLENEKRDPGEGERESKTIGGDQKSVSQKSDEANVMRFEITLPLKNFLSWLECPGINLESAQNAQISKVASGQNDAMPNRTRDIVAQNHSIGTKTVERAAQFS